MRACCSTQLVPKPPTSSEEVFAPESWDLGFGSWSTCCRIASVLSFCLSDPSPTSTTPSPSSHHIPNPLFSTSTIAPAPNPLPLAYELGGKQQSKNKAYVSVFFQPAVIPQCGRYVMYGRILCPKYILCPILYIQYPTHIQG